MKALHASKGLHRALGLGLIGLMMSVPAGQASATTFTVTNVNGTSISSANVVGGVINETWNPNVQEGQYNYSHTDGQGATVIFNQSDLVSTSPVPNSVEFSYSGLSNTGQKLQIKQSIANNTGYDWTDYHASFYYDDNGTWVEFPNLSNSEMDSSQLGTYAWDGFTAHWNFADDPLANGSTGTFTITGKEKNLYALTGASSGLAKLELTPTIVPEPGTLSLLGVGLLGLVGYRRKMVKA